MKRKISALLLCSLLSCHPTEKITPIAPKEEISFNLSIPLGSIDVAYQFSEIQEIDDIGGVFRELAELIANSEINEGNLGKIAFTPCLYKLDQIEMVDFNFINSIYLNSTTFRINSDSKEASFDFLKEAYVYAKFINQKEYDFLSTDFKECSDQTETEDEEKNSEVDYWNLNVDSFNLLLSYSAENTEESTKNKKSIYPAIHINEYKDKLMNSPYVLLFFKVEVSEVPGFEFKVDGELDLKVDIDLNENN